MEIDDIIYSFLRKNDIPVIEFQQFITENRIDYNLKELTEFIIYVDGLVSYPPSEKKKMFFTELYMIDKNNPFLLSKIAGKSLDTTQKLNKSIIAIYEDIKKVMRTFDSGYSQGNFAVTEFVNQDALNTKFKQIVDMIKQGVFPAFFDDMGFSIKEKRKISRFFNKRDDESENQFKFCLYDLAQMLRDFDSHTLEEDEDGDDDYILSDETAPFSHDYAIIRELKAISLDNRPADFLDRVVNYLTENHNNVASINTDMPIIAPRWFLFLYTLLLHSIIPFGSAIVFEKVLKNIFPSVEAITLTQEYIGTGKKTKRRTKSKKNKNKKKKNKTSKK